MSGAPAPGLGGDGGAARPSMDLMASSQAIGGEGERGSRTAMLSRGPGAPVCSAGPDRPTPRPMQQRTPPPHQLTSMAHQHLSAAMPVGSMQAQPGVDASWWGAPTAPVTAPAALPGPVAACMYAMPVMGLALPPGAVYMAATSPYMTPMGFMPSYSWPQPQPVAALQEGIQQQQQQQQQQQVAVNRYRRRGRSITGGSGSPPNQGADGCSIPLPRDGRGCAAGAVATAAPAAAAALLSASERRTSATGSHAALAITPETAVAPVVPPPGAENTGWAWLVEGILQQVVHHLVANSNLQAFRLTCRHWRAVCDHGVRSLVPLTLRPKDLVNMFPRLTVLELTRCANVRNRDLFVLAQSGLPLRCLILGDDVNRPWVSNKGLESIGRITSLQCLALRDCASVTSNGVAELSALRALSSLSLRGCRKVSAAGLEALQVNTVLSSLNLHGCRRVSDRGLAALTHLPLRALSLGLTRVKDEGMAHLARLTQLTELCCTNEELTDAGVALLTSLTELNTLALRECCDVSGDALQALLPALPHLAHLNLYKNWEFGDEQLLKCAPHMLGLHSLDLRGTWVTHRGLAALTSLTGLTRLALAPHVELRPEHCTALASLTQLQALALCCPSYGATLMEAVCQLSQLQELDLSALAMREDVIPQPQPPLPPHIFAALARMRSLTSLDLSRRTAPPAQLHALLAALPRLKTLTLHGCPLAPAALAALERAFPACNVVQRHATLDTAPELATLLGSLSIT